MDGETVENLDLASVPCFKPIASRLPTAVQVALALEMMSRRSSRDVAV